MSILSIGKQAASVIIRTFFLSAATCHAGQSAIPPRAEAAEKSLAAFAGMLARACPENAAADCLADNRAGQNRNIRIQKIETFVDGRFVPDHQPAANPMSAHMFAPIFHPTFAIVAIDPPKTKEKRHMPVPMPVPVPAPERRIPTFLDLGPDPEEPKSPAPKTNARPYGEFGLTDKWVNNVVASVSSDGPNARAVFRDEDLGLGESFGRLPGHAVLGIAFVSVPRDYRPGAPRVGKRRAMIGNQAFPNAARYADDFRPENGAAFDIENGAGNGVENGDLPGGLYIYLYIPDDTPHTAFRNAANVLEFMIEPEKETMVERGGYGVPPADDEQGGCLVLAD